MDRFLISNETENDILTKDFINIIKQSVRDGKITLLEYSYLNDYVEDGGTIVNSEWFFEIINKLDNCELSRLVKKLFPDIFSKIEGKNTIKTKVPKLKQIIIEDKKQHINFTKDQLKGISELIKFLPNFNKRAYGLYGFAGTGKTTIIVEILSFLLKKKLIKSVAFTAPTNKAVTVIKSKFRNYLKEIYEVYFPNSEIAVNFSFDDILDKLYEVKVKIDFITIHKLLKFEKDISLDGDFTFVKSTEGSLISNYEIVIIDECSMIPIDLAEHIYNEIRLKPLKPSDNYKKIPKVIFLGDPAQLPPVGETLSIIFAKSSKDLEFEEYQQILNKTPDVLKSNSDDAIDATDAIDSIEENKLDSNVNIFKQLKHNEQLSKYNLLINDIVSMPNMTLTKVMRSKRPEVTEICYQFRLWALGEVESPQLGAYIKNGVEAFRYTKTLAKTQTKWFEKCMSLYKKGQNCNIILTWTNFQSDEYNRAIRKRLFKDTKISRFMVGDILMLSEFYNMDDGQNNMLDQENSSDKKFYTSEQIKVVKIEQAVKSIPNFKPELSKKASKLQNSKHYEAKYSECINEINKTTKRVYLCWKLSVVKIGDTNNGNENKKQDVNIIYVIHENDEQRYNNEKMFMKLEILKLIKIFGNKFKSKMSTIETNIIKPLWNEFHSVMRDPFANVSYGYAITCHKGQGSNFYNAFVDVDDILKNIKEKESKKCLYTAVTRTSNKLFLLS